MRRLTAALAALAGAAVLLGTAAPAQAATATISGHVTDSNTNPVEGLCVTALRSSPTGSAYLLPVRTDASGDYTISGEAVTAGTYRLQFAVCQNPPYGPASLADLIPEWWDDQPDQASSTTFDVGDGDVITGKDAELQIGGRISGVISGPGGPMAACVDLHGPGFNGTISTVPSGEYSFRRLRAGDFTMRVYDCNGSGALGFEWYDNKPTQAQATPIPLAAAQQLPIDVTLEPAGAISGTLTDPAGAPLEGACVTYYDSGDEEIETVYTDAAGHYSIGGLFPADYRLHYADCDQLDNVAAEFFDDAASLATADPVTVTGGNTTIADAQLARGGSISGLVRGPDQLPLANACVYAFDPLGDSAGYSPTAANGTYRIGSLETGTYRIMFYTCAAAGPTEITEYWRDKPALAGANQIAVTVGSDRPRINATLGAPDPVAPQTTITAGPPAGSTQTVRTASFAFGSSIPGSQFQCRLDAGAWQPCASPRALSGLGDGNHTFRTRAVSPALLLDPSPATRSFIVNATPCEQARVDLAAAEDALELALAKVKRAKARLRKARQSGDATKIRRAKAKLRRAKQRKRAAVGAVAAAQAEVESRC